ncbi:uncharacterized protein LOC124131429 isoform X2 [Haliotis rufescens]|nr:uncharacterized protein LOC124131429 isoform X2 [Haliotis rufescens]
MAENIGNHQYMQSGGMSSRQTGWPPSSSSSNMYPASNHGIPVLSNLVNSLPANSLSMGNQMNYAPRQTSVDKTVPCRPPNTQYSNPQASPWWQHCKISRQACVEFGKLLDAAKDEQRMQNYDIQHLAREDQFCFRRKVQAFLARLCTNQQLLDCINGDLFLTNFFQPYFFNIVKHVTGIDIQQMPGVQDNANAHVTGQPQQLSADLGMLQVNQQCTGGFENHPNRGNIQQFQINGMSARGNSTFTPTSYVKPPPPYPAQGSTQTNHANFYQRGSDNSRSVIPQSVSTVMSSQSRWYKMPAERYESGRVVKQPAERVSPQQRHQEPIGMVVQASSQSVPFTVPGSYGTVSTYSSHATSLDSHQETTRVQKEWIYSQQQISQPTMHAGSVNSDSRSSISFPQTMSQQSNVQSGPEDASFFDEALSQLQTICNSRSLVNTRDSNCSDTAPQQSVQAPATDQIRPNNSLSRSMKETSVLPDSKEHLRQLICMAKSPPAPTVDPNCNVSHLESTAKEPVVVPVVVPVVAPVPAPVAPPVEESTPVAPPVEESTPCAQQLTKAAETHSDIISMPVLVEDQSSRKSESSIQALSLSKQLRSFDMNVLSPFTADVSDSVDRWLSGSKSSDLLDTLTSKPSKENTALGEQMVENETVPCVENQNQSNSSVHKELGDIQPQSDTLIITDDMDVTETSSVSVSHEHSVKHLENSSMKKTHSENQTVSRSLGIYDPPLPVIKHKKRESRISPLKKSNSSTDADVDTPAEDTACSKSKTIESRRHSEGSSKTAGSTFKKKLEVYKASLDTEPLFSVLDNLSARKTAKSKASGASDTVSEGKELSSPHDAEKKRQKSTEVSSSSLQLNEEKSKQSLSDSRDKSHKHHEKNKKCNAEKNSSMKEQHVCIGDRAETTKDRNSHRSSHDKSVKETGNHRSESQSHQVSPTVSAREKVYSKWSVNQKGKHDTGRPHNIGHVRRQSCPDKNGSKCGGNKNKRSLTWDGSTPTLDVDANTSLEEVDVYTEDNAYLPSNGEFIWFHGQKLLMINLPDGKHLIMKEFVKCCLSAYDTSHVYKTKTCTLKINHKTLTHSCRREVEKYLRYKQIKFSSQMGVVLLVNAQKLYHHMLKIKLCAEENCVSSNPPVCAIATREEHDFVQKERSVSPDSTVQSNQQSKALTGLTSPSQSLEGDGPGDVQLNKVSSQSLDSDDASGNDEFAHIAQSAEQEDEGAASDVSDATDIYCDGKPVRNHSSAVSEEGTDDKDCEVIRGGFAIIQKDKMPDRTLRYIVVNGEKCYVYQDIFQLFSKEEVVKVVIHKDMHVAECTMDNAHYLSRLEPKLPPVIPGDCFLIKEKYVRKIFAYFGEPYPKLKLIKNGFKRKSLQPLLALESDSHDDSNCPPPSKKKILSHCSLEGKHDAAGKVLHHHENTSSRDNEKSGTQGMSDACLSKTSGLKRKLEDDGGTKEEPVSKKGHLDDIFNESREYILQAFVTLKEQHKEMAADLACVKTEVLEAKIRKTDLEEKCRKHEGNVTSLKSELSVSKENNLSLEQKYEELEDVLSQLKRDLQAKQEENVALAKERDHHKDFLEKLIGTYRVVDDEADAT